MPFHHQLMIINSLNVKVITVRKPQGVFPRFVEEEGRGKKSMEKRRNSSVLTETLDLDGRRVVDVGCGDGSLVRLMVGHGAEVVGVECNPRQLEKALAETPAGGETYVSGRAENLPLEDGSMDIAVFFNSLHHVAVDGQAAAIGEAGRVLATGGLLYAAEPLAEGPHFDLMKPVHDETEVRARALEVIRSAADAGFTEEREFFYTHAARHENFQAFRERVTTINPETRASFETLETELKAAFQELGNNEEDVWTFDQPMRVNLLRKN